MDYANGKIYKLVSNVIPDIYIGSSTSELKKRKYCHKREYESWQKGLRSYITSFKLFEAGEVEIVLIESFPCTSKYELFARERFWIENTVCVNKNIPGRTVAEYRLQNKDKISERQKEYYKQNKDKFLEYRLQNGDKISEYQKEYREANKEQTKEYLAQNRDKILEQKKEYYEQNKDKLLEYQKEYYEQNKDKILERHKEYQKEYQKEYRLQNKDKLSEQRNKKVVCESCGKEVAKYNLSRHQKTKACSN
jgi:hypothetical protein